jgi:hypothetical protein
MFPQFAVTRRALCVAKKNPIASYRRLHRQSSHSPMQTARLKPQTGNLAFTTSVALALSLFAANFSAAQDKGSVNPEPLPPLENPNSPATPAKDISATRWASTATSGSHPCRSGA